MLKSPLFFVLLLALAVTTLEAQACRVIAIDLQAADPDPDGVANGITVPVSGSKIFGRLKVVLTAP